MQARGVKLYKRNDLMHIDAHRYDGMLWVVQSHLLAASNALRDTNILTHGLPEMDDLHDRIEAIRNDVIAARKALQN